ncbi:MAG: cysteine desulfurase [Gammaproteobacteria bacterium]|nr:cysteine desulfurase [Gammaproteobacteria bacterium]
MSTDINKIRADFPILARQVNGAPLVYLDNAATTQKPQVVIDAISHYYATFNANVHRAAHALSDEATQAFEASRVQVQRFINAASENEIVFTRGTTESINLVASCLDDRLQRDDEIILTHLEHHSNIVPWQMLAKRTGARIVACEITDGGDIDLDDFNARLSERTRIVAIGHVSNAIGTINPIAEITRRAHDQGALVLIDGAQAVAHLAVDVQALDCDFYAFSSHKMFGPTGMGVLFGKQELLEAMPPWQGGGEMIEHVSLQRSTFNRLPYKYEAGTPNIAGAIGLGAAIEYLDGLPREALRKHEEHLVRLTLSQLKQIDGVRLIGEPAERQSVVSFLVRDSHPHDIGTLLDQQGVAVRTGHHCAMPLMERFCIPGTIRASFSLYNSEADVDRFIAGVAKALSFV